MIGLSVPSKYAAIIYGDERDIKGGTEPDRRGGERAIFTSHRFTTDAKPVVISISLVDRENSPHLDPAPVLNIDPRPTLESGKSLEGYVEHPAHPVYYRVEPIFNSDIQLVGALVLGRRGLGFQTMLEARRNRIIMTTAILIALLSASILVLVRRNISRPIEELIARVRSVGLGPWDKRVEVQGEMKSASGAEFTYVRKTPRMYGSSPRSSRTVRAGGNCVNGNWHRSPIGGGLAHEIGTPLNIIGGRPFLLRRSRSPRYQRQFEIIRSQIDRIAGIVRQFGILPAQGAGFPQCRAHPSDRM